MAGVHVSKEVAAKPSELWERIGDFHGLGNWVQGIPPSEPENDGKARRLGAGDNAIVEELVEEGEHSYTYKIVKGPLPVANYVATLKVSPSGDGSLVEWEATFDPQGVPEDQAVMIIEGVFNAGLSNL
jgi:hypothetical protein